VDVAEDGVEGVSGMVGRLVFGLLGDRFGAARVLTLALLAQAVVALGYAAARELGSFYAVAALFGFTYAGVMPLFAVIARENFPLHLMGTVIGGTATASSLGMALGPVAGGLIYDSFSSYVGLFVAAFALGLGAFLAAVAFGRLPKGRAMAG
jgi:MFS family permease